MAYRVDIERMPQSAIIDLQGEVSVVAGWCGEALPPFPQQPNTATSRDGLELYWIGRERWLLRAGLEREGPLLAITRPGAAPIDISVVLVSDTLQFFSIRGPDAGQIVSIAGPLDHQPDRFPANGVSYTEIFGVRGLLVRRADGFEIAVERSYGDLLADYLVRASA
jgi:sarcosine oxidase subunit gamma